MNKVRRFSYIGLLLVWSVIVLCFSACTRITDTSSVDAGNATATPASSQNSAAPAADPVLPIQQKVVSFAGHQQTILADARGFALYFYTPDSSQKTACTDACAVTWPPLLAKSSESVKNSPALSGKLTVQQTANGKQVEYNKHLLYTYIGDSSPGQVTGNGVSSWYVATPDLTPPTS